MEPIKVFICEDDPLFRDLLIEFLSKTRDIEVVGFASTKLQLMIAVSTTQMDVIILDINLTDENYDGIEAAIELKSLYPQLPIIVLSSLDHEEVIVHAMAYGRVDNYILKEHYHDLPEAINMVYFHKSSFHHSSVDKLVKRLLKSEETEFKRKITPIQVKILILLDQGFSRKEIANQLFYNEQSINNELCKLSAVIKGKFPYLEWLRLKKQNTKQLIELAKKLHVIP